MVQVHGVIPESSELLGSLAPSILKEMASELDLQPGKSPLLSQWDRTVCRAPVTRKSYRVKMCEFGAWVEAGEG